MAWISFGLYCLVFVWLLGMFMVLKKKIICHIWEVFSHYFLEYCFMPVHLALSSIPMTQMLDVLLQSHRSLRLC